MTKHNKELQRISRELASIQRRQANLQEINDLIRWMQFRFDDPDTPATLIRANLARIIRLAKKEGLKIDPEFLKDIKRVDNIGDIMTQLDRAFRKYAKRKPEPEVIKREPHICAYCNKREAHFGDLCKRCANELGVRPTGKVT
jgi:hypothetical protein